MRKSKIFLMVVVLLTISFTQLNEAHAANVTLPFRVNFQPQTSTIPSGYFADYGQAFDTNRGFGWFNAAGAAASFVGNGRERNAVTDQRLDTFMHMQLPAGSAGVTGNATWKASVPNGTYDVTVGVGDPIATNSRNVIRIEGAVVVDYTPTAAAPTAIRTARVTVADNFFTVDSTGGTNTKISFIDITPATSGPYVSSVDPSDGATGVAIDKSVTVQLSTPVDATTLSAGLKVLNSAGTAITGYYNTDAAGSNATFVPSTNFAANSRYTVQTNSSLKTSGGVSYANFTSSFTTGTSTTTPGAGVNFTKSTFSSLTGVTAMTLGPNNTLYAGTATGSIWKYTLATNGTATGTPVEITAFKNARTITGLRFDPSSTATNTKLWVSSGELCGANCANFTGMVSVLTGTTTPTVRRDVITGLPRSVKDHMTNGIDFGPDQRLYISQGSLSGYGAPDAAWGNRAETPLSASILVADVNSDTRFASTVNVNTSTGYNVNATNAPVKVYAEGVRNVFSIAWASNGKLYAPGNQAASGNAPAGPNGTPPALQNLPAYNDYFTQIVAGGYYGHPNPSRNHYALNGANPTTATDPFQVNEYPVGIQPDANWRKPDLDLGQHRSPNGVVEFKSSVFGTGFRGRLLVTEYSQGKDVIAVSLDANGNAVSKAVVSTGFYNPIAIATDATSGRVYVAEFGSDPDGQGGKLTLMTPAP